MAVIEGYTVPDTLEECQAAIVVLLQQAKRTGDVESEEEHTLNEAMGKLAEEGTK